MPYSDQRRLFLTHRILPLALCLCLSGAAWAVPEAGMLPSLDLPAVSDGSPAMTQSITPISELTGNPIIEQPAEHTASGAESLAPSPLPQPTEAEQPTLKPKQSVTDIQQSPATARGEAKPSPKQSRKLEKSQKKAAAEAAKKVEAAAKPAEEQPAPRLEHQPELPAAEAIKPAITEAKAAKPKFSLANLGLSNPFQPENAIKPVSYAPLPGIAIFPVIKHGNDKAFSDLPLIFAREYALKMEQKVPETKVFHPIYTVDELRIQGMGHVYDQVMKYYLKAGRPEPAALDYLLKQLGSSGHSVSRVVFVEADLDTGHPDAATGLIDRAKALMTDGTPQQMRYFVRSHLQIFDAEKPDFPMVWSGSWSRTVKNNQFFNVTPSVFADSDSQQAFAKVSRDMSRELLYVTPKAAYMAPQYDTQVQGKLVSGKEQAFPNLTETNPNANQLTKENKQAIQRILQRQNAISP